jgi:hypothetical protein
VTAGTISINGATAAAVKPSQGLHAIQVAKGTTKFTLNLPAAITTESRPHGSIAVQRGPLHYALDLSRTSKVLKVDPDEARAIDWEFDVASNTSWQYAIDPATLAFHTSTPTSGKLPSPVFDKGGPPLFITAKACPINWAVAGDTFAAPPPENPTCTGAAVNVTLTPYGVCLDVHLAT